MATDARPIWGLTCILPLLLPALTACMPRAAAELTPADGRSLYEANCAACHGASGKGDGPVAATLETPPADLTRIAARRGGVWPVLEVMSIIDGYTQATNPRPDMPVLSEISEGPTVAFDSGNGLTTQVPARLLAVADYLETIQSPPPERYVP